MLPFPPGSILLAPMVGITNRAFRTLVDELGPPDWAFTEMASAEAFLANAANEETYTDPSPHPEACSVQFFARSAPALAEACSRLASRPQEKRPAGIDINFGCSAPHIRRMGGGSAWSSDKEGASALVAAARAAWPGPLSAKLRLGADADYSRLLDFCSALAAAGADFLTIHPRTDSQKLRRKPRWELIARLAADLSLPIVANGDIRSSDDVSALLKEGASAVMIGREAARKPWVFSVLHSASAGSIDALAVGIRFLELADTLLPPPWRKPSSRRFFEYYCEQFSFAHHVRCSLASSSDSQAAKAVLADYFAQVPSDRFIEIGPRS